MANPGSMTIDANANDFTLTVRFTRRFRFRLWLGSKILQFGAWIIGANYEQKEAETETS